MASPKKTIQLDSSLLASISYGDDGTLDAHLRNGGVYRYLEVPKEVVDALLAADSKGAYFNRHIRDRFQCERLAPAAKEDGPHVVTVQLTHAQSELVNQAIAAGRIHREEDAIREAFAMWEERERQRTEILVMVEEAEASLDRGEGIELNEDALKEFVKDIARRGRDRLAASPVDIAPRPASLES